VADMPIEVIVPSVALVKVQGGSAVDDTMDGPTWKGWGFTMASVPVAPLCTKGTVVTPSSTTSVQARGVVVVVLLGHGKRISSGRFDDVTWGRLPRSFAKGTVAAFDGVSVPSLVVVDRCQRRWTAFASSAWISTSVATGVVATGVATVVATGVPGFSGLAIAAATWAGTRDGWKERDSTRAAHNVREGTRGTDWTAALSFGTGTEAQSKATPVDVSVDVSTEETEEFFFWHVDRIVPTPV